MADITNTADGARGFHAASGFVLLEPGESWSGDITDGELVSAKGTGHFDVSSGATGDGPDYERDSLGSVDLHKPATSKAVLLVIAAYEQADVPQGDEATKAELIKAIEAKRAKN